MRRLAERLTSRARRRSVHTHTHACPAVTFPSPSPPTAPLLHSPLPSPSSPSFSPFLWSPSTPLSSAITLPSPYYTQPSVLSWERQTVFSSSWLHVGRLSQLPHPGSFFTSTLLSAPLLVCRDDAGEVRAFYNVCAHHAMAVAQGDGRVEKFTCPYHGWEYALDGRLRKATKVKGMEGFKASQVALTPIPVRVVGPWVFVQLPLPSHSSASSPPAAASGTASTQSWAPLDALCALLEPTGYASLAWVRRVEYDVQCNWKVFTDNYLDGGFHVSYAHPSLASSLELSSYTTTVLSPYLSVQSSAAASSPSSSSSSSPSSYASSAPARVSGRALYAYLYPTFMVNRYGRWMDSNTVIPLTQQSCRVVIEYWAEDGVSEAEREAGMAASHDVQMEDVALCEAVQRGLDSGVYVHGRYAPTVEHAMHAMHVTYYNNLTRSPQQQPPQT